MIVATITGRRVLNRVLYLAKKLGYEASHVSESKRKLLITYTVTFKKRR